jgi:hypothetical protein
MIADSEFLSDIPNELRLGRLAAASLTLGQRDSPTVVI